jgi:hypothetical protein
VCFSHVILVAPLSELSASELAEAKLVSSSSSCVSARIVTMKWLLASIEAG